MSVEYKAGIVYGYPVRDTDIVLARHAGLTDKDFDNYKISLDGWCGTGEYIFGLWCGQAPMGGWEDLDDILHDGADGDIDEMVALYEDYFKHKPAQPRLMLIGQVF